MVEFREETLTEVLDLWLVYQKWDKLKTRYGLESLDDLPNLLYVVEGVTRELQQLELI